MKKKTTPYADRKNNIKKTKQEINELLKRFGVTGIQWTWTNNQEALRFIHEYEQEGVKHGLAFEIKVPEMGHRKGRGGYQKLVRNDNQAYRIIWHVLKNRFVAIECGLKTFENEFLSEMIYKLKNGKTTSVGDVILNQISQASDNIKLLED